MTPQTIHSAADALTQRGAIIAHHDEIAASLTIGSRVQIFTPDTANQTCELVIETGDDLHAIFNALRGRFQTRLRSLDTRLHDLGVDTSQLSSID
ncbi:hypothetical protein [Microvirga sp. VF16]|uniref:hypothetical protein n=1 Tax=Microvirga sp. VF16 TaxID=2807101 RepID=UPI00193EAB50|nr:hypothetical protein [Microvirga sp. VF16]QRM35103.1 hypothetical protein JO965_39580 [Microvirga sp. VF16]